MLHYLRIAVTALSLTACVLLVALWVRSYWWADECTLASRLMIRSRYGCITYHFAFAYSFEHDWNYSYRSIPHDSSTFDVAKAYLFLFKRQSISRPGFVPYWLVILPPAILTVVPWIGQLKWRFTLRALLIATTLVAAVLGMIMVMA